MRIDRCRRCGQDKPADCFYSDSTNPDKLRKPCKACLSEERRERYQRLNGIDASYEQVLRREYGITLDDYNQMVRKQGNRCAICRRAESSKSGGGRTRRLSVDHDHATGAVRGLLCQRCNTVVWSLEDNHVTITAVTAYIEEWRATFADGPPL